MTPWTAAHQASLSIITFQSLLKLMFIELAMPHNLSSSVVPFSSCPQSFPASGSFPASQFFTSGSQSIGVSPSASVLPMNIGREPHEQLTKNGDNRGRPNLIDWTLKSGWTLLIVRNSKYDKVCGWSYILKTWKPHLRTESGFWSTSSTTLGKGNPLQYSYLENSMDRGAWWATVHKLTKSQTWLSTTITSKELFLAMTPTTAE